jgi:hypothetical protein
MSDIFLMIRPCAWGERFPVRRISTFSYPTWRRIFAEERLIDVPGQRGIGQLVSEVLRESEPMLQMCRELGFAIASEPRDPAVMLVRKKLPEN